MREYSETAILGDCLEMVIDHRGKTPKKLGADFVSSGVPVLSAKHVHNGRLSNIDEIRFVDFDVYKRWMKEDLKKGDCLLSSEGATLGECLYWDNDYPVVLGQRLFGLRAKKGVLDSKYLYALMRTSEFQGQVQARASGTSVFGLRQTEVLELEIQLPPIEDQIQIGDFVYSINTKIDLLHRNNKTLEEMAETLFRQWFVEGAKEEWEVKNLGDIVNTVLGGTPNTSIPDYWDGDIAWINSGEVNKDRIIKPTRYISEKGLKNSSAKLLPKKSTVIAITGATMGQVSFLEIDTCANQSVIGLIPNEVYYAEFLHLLVKNHIVDMVQNETGGAQPHINKNDVNSTPVKLPPVEKLASKKECFQSLYSKVGNNWEQISDLEKTRDALLPKLISGQVRVNT